jgi:hypothetical protein
MKFTLRQLMVFVALTAVWIGLYNWLLGYSPVTVRTEYWDGTWLRSDSFQYWLRYHFEAACLATMTVCCLITAVGFVRDVRRDRR